MENTNTEVETKEASFATAFFSKLKQQSFTIMIMIAIVYYQHTMWARDKEEFKESLISYQQRYEELVNNERARLLERERYLMSHRDQFIDLLKEQATWQKATRQK